MFSPPIRILVSVARTNDFDKTEHARYYLLLNPTGKWGLIDDYEEIRALRNVFKMPALVQFDLLDLGGSATADDVLDVCVRHPKAPDTTVSFSILTGPRRHETPEEKATPRSGEIDTAALTEVTLGQIRLVIGDLSDELLKDRKIRITNQIIASRALLERAAENLALCIEKKG